MASTACALDPDPTDMSGSALLRRDPNHPSHWHPCMNLEPPLKSHDLVNRFSRKCIAIDQRQTAEIRKGQSTGQSTNLPILPPHSETSRGIQARAQLRECCFGIGHY